MKFNYVVLVGVLSGMLINCGEVNMAPDATVLVNNEHAFAESVAKEGIRSGFLKHIADDGILFSPGAVNGFEHYTNSAELSGLLAWKANYAEIAGSGKMGWTTGPWEFQRSTESDTVFAYGHYITIWKMQPDSVWKFVLDIGISHDKVALPSSLPTLKVLAASGSGKETESMQSNSDLIELETAFSLNSTSEGTVAAYLPQLATDVRYYNEGAFPFGSIDQIKLELEQIEGALTWQPAFADVSECGTMGYTYGTASLRGESEVADFSYVHIWRKNDAGSWQLALDVRVPIPPASQDAP